VQRNLWKFGIKEICRTGKVISNVLSLHGHIFFSVVLI
jgi:hypothetical protein